MNIKGEANISNVTVIDKESDFFGQASEATSGKAVDAMEEDSK